MKNLIYIYLGLSLIFIPLVSFGQSEQPANRIVTDSFVKNYNSEDYKAIFSMFSIEMQKSLTIDSTIEFLTTLKLQAGSINNREFTRYEDGGHASYKTTFERAVLRLNISIDNDQKINGLFVKLFVDEAFSKDAINKLLIKDNSVSKHQTKLMFERFKSFPN